MYYTISVSNAWIVSNLCFLICAALLMLLVFLAHSEIAVISSWPVKLAFGLTATSLFRPFTRTILLAQCAVLVCSLAWMPRDFLSDEFLLHKKKVSASRLCKKEGVLKKESVTDYWLVSIQNSMSPTVAIGLIQ